MSPQMSLISLWALSAAVRRRSRDWAEGMLALFTEWTLDDYSKLAEVVSNPSVMAALDLCSSRPGDWIPLREVERSADRTRHQARADLAGLTMMVKHRFGRSNWPFVAEWQAAGPNQIYYRMSDDQAKMWLVANETTS